MDITPSCALCRHKNIAPTCMAFPEGIPDEIITGINEHLEPYKGDHGIQFDPIKED